MMEYPVCARCLQPIYPPGCTLTVDSRYICTCTSPMPITFTTSSGTVAPPSSVSDWNKNLKAMRNWKVTLHGRIDDQKEPVPQAFQDAFKDEELEL
jgi:hypothetical protein